MMGGMSNRMDHSDLLSDARSPFHWVLVLAGGVVAWFVKRDYRRVDDTLKDHAQQIDELQKDRVTKNDFDELRASITATITNGFARAQDKMDEGMTRTHDRVDELYRDLMMKQRGGGSS